MKNTFSKVSTSFINFAVVGIFICDQVKIESRILPYKCVNIFIKITIMWLFDKNPL